MLLPYFGYFEVLAFVVLAFLAIMDYNTKWVFRYWKSVRPKNWETGGEKYAQPCGPDGQGTEGHFRARDPGGHGRKA